MKEWVKKLWENISDRDLTDAEYAADEDFFLDAHKDLFSQALDPAHAARLIVNRYHLFKMHNFKTWAETINFYNENNSSL